MRYALWTVILIGLGAASARADSADLRFFPVSKGSSWVYATTNKKKHKSFDMVVTVQGPWEEKTDSGTLHGVILAQKDTRGQMREFLLVQDDGIFIWKLGLSKALTPEVFTRFRPAVPRVIFPLKPGTKVHWEGRLKVLTINKPIVFDGEVVGWEDVDVPAGHYHCIKLHYHEKRGDEVTDENAWYADGVGQVKYDGGEYVKELKKVAIAQ